MKLRDFRDFFRDEELEAEIKQHSDSRSVLDWMSADYHKTFVDWLDDQASQPIDVSDSHSNMIQAAVRANTFKEIKKHLDRLESNARAALAAAQE